MQVTEHTKEVKTVTGIRLVRVDNCLDDGYQENPISPVFLDIGEGITALSQAEEWMHENMTESKFYTIPNFSGDRSAPEVFPQFKFEKVEVMIPVYTEKSRSVSVSPGMKDEVKKALQIAEEEANSQEPVGYKCSEK